MGYEIDLHSVGDGPRGGDAINWYGELHNARDLRSRSQCLIIEVAPSVRLRYRAS